MGNRSTRVITPEEAGALLGAAEQSRFEGIFLSLCRRPRGVAPMDEQTFTIDVLGAYPDIPKFFASRLFAAFDTNGSGDVDVEEFLCGVAVLLKGSQEQRLRFCFHVYEREREGYIRTTDLTVAYLNVFSGKRFTAAQAEKAVAGLISAIKPRRGDQIALDEWLEWGRASGGDRTLLAIVFDLKQCFITDGMVQYMAGSLDPAAKRKVLAGTSLFSEAEVAHAQAAYSRIRSASPSGVVDLAAVQSVFGRFLPPTLTSRLFTAWDRSGVGAASVEAFLLSLSRCCNGSITDKMGLAFQLYDNEGKGVLSPDAVVDLVTAVVWTELATTEADFGVNPTATAASAVARTLTAAKQAKSKLDSLYESLKLANGSSISFDVYSGWISKHPEVLNVLDTITQVARIELGIRPGDVREEAALIQSVYKDFDPVNPGAAGDVWYILRFDWWKRWCQVSGFGGCPIDPNPDLEVPPISNVSITIKDGPGRSLGALKENLYRDSDYKIVTPRVWSALSKWYGATQDLPRYVIDTTLSGGSGKASAAAGAPTAIAVASEKRKLELELYPLVISIRRMNKEGKLADYFIPFLFSRVDTLSVIRKRACESYFISDPNNTRLWYRAESTVNWRPLRDLTFTLEAEHLVDCGEVLLESQQSDGSWALAGFREDESSAAAANSKASTGNSALKAVASRPRGLVGLFNLGNTCYMNSALQCLSNSPLFTEYFLRNEYLYDINTKAGGMGTGGQLAVDFAELMQEMWSSDSSLSAVHPKRFKATLGRFKPQFENNDQQDSQEMLTVLMEGLCEDLNRVKKKPYIQNPDSNGRPDAEVAEEWWLSHLARERSIVSLFEGQYKSSVRCHSCGDVSASFEPFSILQLPLPEPLHRFIRVTVVFRNGVRRPVSLSVKVPKTGTIADLKFAMEKMRPGNFLVTPDVPSLQVLSVDLIVTKIDRHQIVDISIKDDVSLSTVKESDYVVMFQMPPLSLFQTSQPLEATFSVGGFVQAKWKGSAKMYNGVVTGVNEDGTFAVKFDDGDFDPAVPRESMVPREITIFDVAIMHRQFTPSSRYSIYPFRPTLFGTPFIIRVQPDLLDGPELYNLVLSTVKRYIRCQLPIPDPPSLPQARSSTTLAGGSSVPTLESHGPSPSTVSLEKVDLLAAASVDSDDDAALPSARSGLPSAPKVSARDRRIQREIATMKRWGFVIRNVSPAGDVCGVCPWYSKCPGCPVLPTAAAGAAWRSGHLAIDWDPAIMLEFYDRTEASKEDVHPSVESNRALEDQPIQLSTCLNVFNQGEKLTDHYCSKCSRPADGGDIVMRTMTKQMDLYRLPPLLVIQLKRFQFNQFSRRKLYNLVMFPVQGLDLSEYLSKDPVKCPPPDLSYWEFLGGKRMAVDPCGVDTAAMSSGGSQNAIGTPPIGSRERNYEGIPLSLSRDNVVYNLYGVVNHHGMLGAGHYTAYCRSPTTRRWHCFNDRIVSDLDEVTVQSSNAYLLFYARQDMEAADVGTLFPRMGVEPADITKLSGKTVKPGSSCTVQ